MGQRSVGCAKETETCDGVLLIWEFASFAFVYFFILRIANE